ncbi:MAG: type II toxin-antitoxin system VapC family toxin [Candidatus Omnitrophica bacterium]|nr:type II toxin-antitoxin system VapC family toxin [Candidatus Omnitrophota bacterium]
MHIDTHVAVWLYAGEVERFPAPARRLLDQSELVISPMVLLEIQFLREAGKLELRPERFLREMKQDLGLKVCEAAFPDIIFSAVELSWTRDPFDRFITAQAAVNEAPLMTRDKTIRTHYRRAVWD